MKKQLTEEKLKLYHSYRWRVQSKRLRDMGGRYALCWYCNNMQGTSIDHVDSRDMDLFYDTDNMVGSCTNCMYLMQEDKIQPMLDTTLHGIDKAIDKAVVVRGLYGMVGLNGFVPSVDKELLKELWYA